MKINEKSKYILYIVLFMIFALVRFSYIFSTSGITDIDFKSMAIASSQFPFGIIKNSALLDYFSPVYYFLLHFVLLISKNEIFLRSFNAIIGLINIFVFINIGKKLQGRKLGIFLAIFISVNHFYLYYSNLIAPYCLDFLIGSLLINSLIDFIKKPNKKHFKNLNIFNCIFILINPLNCLYIASEFIIFYFLTEKRQYLKKIIAKLGFNSLITFLLIFPIAIFQYATINRMLIPLNMDGIGLNLSSLGLLINDYISPYLSFLAPETQTKSTLGMLYSFFLNTDLKNINTIKILITLFYSSILPLSVAIIFTFSAYKKDNRLKILFLLGLINLGFILLLNVYEILDTNPIYCIQFFITCAILLGYGIFSIKDILIQSLIIFCIITIQFINPEINSFNITINKKYATINVFNVFLKSYELNNQDLIIMPYLSNFAKLYYKDLTFFNFDYSELQKNSKNSLTKELTSKKAKTINKNNVFYLLYDYLAYRGENDIISKYFIENCIENSDLDGRIVLFIDKLNSKPLSIVSIERFSKNEKYNPRLKKIDPTTPDISKNQSRMLFDTLKSKVLYEFIVLLQRNFYCSKIIEYKKIDNDYYEIKNNTKNITNAINSFDSDYVFIIFHKI